MYSSPTNIISILLIFSLWGCSEANNNEIPDEVGKLENLIEIQIDAHPTHEISVQKDRVFGDFESEEEIMGSISDIAVDDFGRVYLADTQQKTIHVFNSDGQFLQNLGRSGTGPGEFDHIFDMKIQENRLFAFDPSLFRINFYSLESLTFDHVVGLYPQDWIDNQDIRDASLVKFYDWCDDNMLIGFKQIMGPHIYYHIVQNSNQRTRIIPEPILVKKNDEKTTLDIELPNGYTGIMGVPFGRKSLIAVNKNRHIFEAWTDHFLIKEYDSKGTYLRALYYPYQNPSLAKADINSLVNPDDFPYIKKALNEYNAPETWPALEDLRVDNQNRLWVSTVVNDPSMLEWWILETDGRLIGRFKWPRNKSIEEIKNGFIYTVEPDGETGEKEVIRYRVMMSERGQG